MLKELNNLNNDNFKQVEQSNLKLNPDKDNRKISRPTIKIISNRESLQRF